MVSWIASGVSNVLSMVFERHATTVRRMHKIPTDILSDILSRLPAASLERVRYVCKEWFEIISDPNFAETHFARQPMEFELIYTFLFFHKPGLTDSFFLRNPGQGCYQNRKIPAEATVFCSFKGLVLYEKDKELYVANPLTGDTLSLPSFPGQYSPVESANIGCGPSSKEYKVLVLRRMGYCRILTLQRVGCSAWRKVDFTPRDSLRRINRPIYSKGCLHWINHWGIISLDLGQEKILSDIEFPFGRMEDRRDIQDKGPLFLEWDGGLAVVHNFRWEPSYSIFILRDSKWTKLQVDVTFFKHLCPCEAFGQTPPFPIASLRNGEIIIFKKAPERRRLNRFSVQNPADDNCFFAYNLRDGVMVPFAAAPPQGKSIYDYHIDGYYRNGSIIPHVDSVVPCRDTAESTLPRV